MITTQTKKKDISKQQYRKNQTGMTFTARALRDYLAGCVIYTMTAAAYAFLLLPQHLLYLP